MFYKIDVLKDFAKFTGKHLYWSLFLIKETLLKKDSDTGVFLETFKNSFLSEI